MPQSTEAQKRASSAWYQKNKATTAVARKEKYAENSEARQKIKNNAKRSYYKRKLAELDDEVPTIEEIEIVVPPSTSPDTEERMKLNFINYII